MGESVRGPRVRLVEPRVDGPRVSGGWRYGEALLERLQAARIGDRVVLEPGQLAREAALAGASGSLPQLVFDSLFLSLAEPPDWLLDEDLAGRCHLLMHYLPSSDPTLEAEEAARLRGREARWLGAVGSCIATAPALAAEIEARHGVHAAVAIPGVGPLFRGPRRARAHDTALEVVCCGPVAAAKNQVQLARQLAELARTRSQAVRLVLLGDHGIDPEATAAVRRAAGEHLQLVFEGAVDSGRVATALATCDLFVSVSLFESFGMAVAEAVASGAPVLATRVGEAARFVTPGVNGRLIEPGDEQALGRCLAELLIEQPELAQRGADLERLRVPTWEHTFAAFLGALGLDFARAAGVRPAGHLERYSACRLPTAHGEFDVTVYRYGAQAEEALVISLGELSASEPLFTRLHSECFTGEILHSLKCDCRGQLELALQTIQERGRGALLYLRQEGRGIGLGNKIAAYGLQQRGADTVEANHALGLPTDLRDFAMAGAILRDLQVAEVELNTNNPDKVAALASAGIAVSGLCPSHVPANPHSEGYLRTKAHRLGHALNGRSEERSDGRSQDLQTPRGIVFDIDGVLMHDERVEPGATELLDALRARGIALRFLTNDGINSRRSRIAAMERIGLSIPESELFTASSLGRRLIDRRGWTRILPLMGEPALEEFSGLEIDFEAPQAVVCGDWFGDYDTERLAAAHACLERGAELVALHNKKSWPTRGGRRIDLGFWVAGLEHCSGRDAILAGKPAAFAYAEVLADAQLHPRETWLIADEIEPDLVGAQATGLTTVLFDPAATHPTHRVVDTRLSRLEELLELLPAELPADRA